MQSIIQVHDLQFQPFISPEKIQERVAELGQKITQDYQETPPLFVAVLNGAFIFAADLVRACDLDSTINFVKLSSYEGLSSSGVVKSIIGLDAENVAGRHIIIIEDIIDTGNTIAAFQKDLKELAPASVKIASLLLKPDALQHDLSVDYLGFSIPSAFVIGYGLDYDEKGRNLPGIYQKI